MSEVRATIEIAAAPQQIWDVVTDPQRLGDWVTIHRRLDEADGGPLRTGFKMRQTMCLRGANFHVDWELVECQAPRLARWEGRGPARSHATSEYRLSEIADGTCFDYTNEFRAPFGPLGAAASRALVGGIPGREANATLHKLKSLLEGDR